MILQIKNAINHFNDNRKENEVKLTQTTLGIIVLPELTPKVSGYYISRWCNGKQYGKLKPEHVIEICEKCKVDPNFLYGFKK